MSIPTLSNILDTPVGKIIVHSGDNKLLSIRIGSDKKTAGTGGSEVFRLLSSELKAYFKDKGFRFSVPYDLQGTAFQRRVWQALTHIPAGKTKTYGQLARDLNSSPRAIGNACRANPLPIIIPCHRVVAKRGIGGYDGETAGTRLDIKRWLLRHEGVSID